MEDSLPLMMSSSHQGSVKVMTFHCSCFFLFLFLSKFDQTFKIMYVMLFIVNETSSGLEGCTFETGTCHWEDKSVGQSQWVRGRNATGNTGPPVDHTLGTDLGNEKKKINF